MESNNKIAKVMYLGIYITHCPDDLELLEEIWRAKEGNSLQYRITLLNKLPTECVNIRTLAEVVNEIDTEHFEKEARRFLSLQTRFTEYLSSQDSSQNK